MFKYMILQGLGTGQPRGQNGIIFTLNRISHYLSSFRSSLSRWGNFGGVTLGSMGNNLGFLYEERLFSRKTR